MDRKSDRGQPPPIQRRRPPARIPTPVIIRSPSPDSQSNIMSINIPGNPQVTPVFASVHRPRQSSISAIQRENQQRRLAQIAQIRQHNNAYDPVMQDQFMENNKHQIEQSMNVSIPHPYPPPFHQQQFHHQKKVFSMQHYQQQQKHQQQLQQSRIPTVTPCFNQISKSATNILNDIYEKHLLSQTTFENVNTVNMYGSNYAANGSGTVRPEADLNFNNLCHQQQTYHHQQFIKQQNGISEINKNQNVPYASSGGSGIANYINHPYTQQPNLTKNPRGRMPRKISESAMKMQKNTKNTTDRQSNGISGRKQPTGGNELDLYEVSYVHRTKTDINLLYGATDLSAVQSKQYSDVNGKISVRAEPLGGNFYEENVCEYGSSVGGENKYEHRNSKINIMLETAQAMAAAAYFARAAQRMANNNGISKSRVPEMPSSERGGYCGALQRAPPPMPAGLARRLANKDNFGMGKVKVMLRISDSHPADATSPHYLCIDKKKRQVTLTDPTTATPTVTSQERGPMVAAPKMFAFDGLFTCEDLQSDICASALSEVIPAVLEGSDGCLLTLGYPSAGQTKTMFGSVSPSSELGAIPCAISWLYKGINERRQKSGSRFSVRVSALGVSATKPGASSKDLLAAHKTESDESPSSYLRDDFLGGPTELRAPTAERAALFLDAALAGRHQSSLEPALIFTLHVYQYSLGGKGAVAGGRSRLHLIDLGGCANRNGGLPLSGIGNVLLAILSGQRHPPNRDHPLTPLLKDCLAPLTCHVSVLAHVAHTQTHTDALTTIQLASRIHRLRRRKHRFPLPSDKTLGVNNTGHQSGSSEGPDPSSSDLSADTVIYMGPGDDATDGEHPPVYLPSLSSGDNRCFMNKALKGSVAEKPSKLPQKKTMQKPQSPVPTQRTDSLKRRLVANSSPVPGEVPSAYQFNSQIMVPNSCSLPNSPKMVAAAFKQAGINKGSNVPTPKGSPLRRNQGSPKRQTSAEEQWIDGPRLSKSKVAEARYLLREINHVKQREQWIDGPKMSPAKSLAASSLPAGKTTPGYGYMDSHKKTMIRQWVENQSSQIFLPNGSSPQPPQQILHLTQFKTNTLEDGQVSEESNNCDLVIYTNSNVQQPIQHSESSAKIDLNQGHEQLDQRSVASSLNKHNDQISERSGISSTNKHSDEEEDEDSGPSEVPPALPLIQPLSSREISHDSLHMMCSRHVSRESLGMVSHHIQTKDCGLQVTEDDIVKAMGEHPLSALSHGNVSVVSSFNNVGDAYSDCVNGDRTKHQFDQLARLREIYTSQLAMAEVVPAFRINDTCSVFSEPAYRFIAGPGSVCSEPAYRPPSPRCSGCRQSIGLSRTPSQTSLPSLNGIVAIAGMEQYASLRHPDGASDPNLQKSEKLSSTKDQLNPELLHKPPSIDLSEHKVHSDTPEKTQNQHPPQLPPLPLSTPEAYDSGHDSSTPRTSKHSGISRRAESGYHSVATVRDSDESSYGSAAYRGQRITVKKRGRQDKSLCNWLRNPFTCTYPDTEGEISDF